MTTDLRIPLDERCVLIVPGDEHGNPLPLTEDELREADADLQVVLLLALDVEMPTEGSPA